MKTSRNGVLLIKKFEGLRLTPYLCPAGKWTVGYGHTDNVIPYESISIEQADIFFHQDLDESEKALTHLCSVNLNQNQFDALVSFIFNVGQTKFSDSTLLAKVNANLMKEATDEFMRWIYAGGVPQPGLKQRRKAEKILFEQD